MSVLPGFRTWAPFRIDALGIVTLLGTESLRQVLGRLVHNGVAEYLPLMAAQVIADNTFAEPVPGFVLYNITDKIKATDLSAWFTRWLLCQDLTYCSSTLFISVNNSKTALPDRHILDFAVSLPLNVFPITFASLIGDWFGFVCAIGTALTAAARASRLHLLRQALDDQVIRGVQKSSDQVKVFVTLPNGKSVSILTSRGIVLGCLLTEICPRNHFLHLALQGLTWLAFGVAMVTLGMACLVMQVIIVAWLIVPSAIVLRQFGCDESRISPHLRINRNNAVGIDTRAKCYARLSLLEEEERAFVDWHLFPQRSNQSWWKQYRICQHEFRANSGAFEEWAKKLGQEIHI
jgi:hypothetical protein